MSVTADIVESLRAPGRVVLRRLAGAREDRALVLALMVGVLYFVAQAPWQARLAHLDDTVPLEARLYWSAFFWVMIVPLLLYGLAFVGRLVSRVAARPVSGIGARIALFWALMAAVPAALLAGMVAGMIGPGPALSLVLLIWLALFFRAWIAGLRVAAEEAQDA